MSRKFTFLIALLFICAGLAYWLWQPAEKQATPLSQNSSVKQAKPPKGTGNLHSPNQEPSQRQTPKEPTPETTTPDPQPTGESPSPQDPAPAKHVLWARFLDRDGKPIPELSLGFEFRNPAHGEAPFQATTDANGLFPATPVPTNESWRVYPVLHGGLSPVEFSSPLVVKISPIPQGDPPLEFTLPHGPRIFVALTLPPGTYPRDLMVEFHANPSMVSSQIGGLGGMAPMHEDHRGLWAWAPKITNGVRDTGGKARVLSRDGLWASPWVPIETLSETGAPRRVENEDELHFQTTLEPRATLHFDTNSTPPPFTFKVVQQDKLLALPASQSDKENRQTFRWLPPGTWTLPEYCQPTTVTATAGQATTVLVHIQAE